MTLACVSGLNENSRKECWIGGKSAKRPPTNHLHFSNLTSLVHVSTEIFSTSKLRTCNIVEPVCSCIWYSCLYIHARLDPDNHLLHLGEHRTHVRSNNHKQIHISVPLSRPHCHHCRLQTYLPLLHQCLAPKLFITILTAAGAQLFSLLRRCRLRGCLGFRVTGRRSVAWRSLALQLWPHPNRLRRRSTLMKPLLSPGRHAFYGSGRCQGTLRFGVKGTYHVVERASRRMRTNVRFFDCELWDTFLLRLVTGSFRFLLGTIATGIHFGR